MLEEGGSSSVPLAGKTGLREVLSGLESETFQEIRCSWAGFPGRRA